MIDSPSPLLENKTPVDYTKVAPSLRRDLESALTRTIDSRGRGISAYASCFAMEDEDFIRFVGEDRTLDLGSGPGNLAVSSAIVGHRTGNPNLQAIDSLNIRFALPNYDEITPPLPIDLPSTYTKPSHDEIVKAEEVARAHRLAYSWFDLSQIPDEYYGRIVSVSGFPYYSDFGKAGAERPEQGQRVVQFGEESRGVFEQLAQKLKPGGTMLLHNNFQLAEWERSGEIHRDVADFFSQLGTTFRVMLSGQSPHRQPGQLDTFSLIAKPKQR